MPRTKTSKKKKTRALPSLHGLDLRYADAIFCADLHLRETTPRCRTDNFREAMIGKLGLLRRLQSRYKCPVIIAGDIFDSWKCSHWLTRLACEMFPPMTWVIPGQHDLPGHRTDKVGHSPLGVLEAAGKVNLLMPSNQTVGKLDVVGAFFGDEEEAKGKTGDVLVLHRMVWHREKPYPNAPDEGEAYSVLAKFPGFPLIVTGDNHIPFSVHRGGRVLVNCGSMMRTSSTQRNHQPVFWAYTKHRNVVTQISVHVDPHAVTESEKMEQKTKGEFDDFLREVGKIGTSFPSFTENMKRFLQSHPQKGSIEHLIWEAMEA